MLKRVQWIMIALLAILIAGCGSGSNKEDGSPEINSNTYTYGKMGKTTVEITPSSQDVRVVVYHPTSWDNTPTPVIFFAPGWHNTTHTSYTKLLTFIASHGYSVIYMPDTGSYPVQIDKFDTVVNEFVDKFDTSKIGIMGHSAGGSFVYLLLEHMINQGYGIRENGVNNRFMFVMDGYFAQNMDKSNMETLADTNVVYIQFGPSGNSTDPRVMLVNYKLLMGNNIDKNYIVLKNDNDHGYPGRQNIDNMQGMLKPLDALIEYTFKKQSKAHHKIALEGAGKIDPYLNAYQKVLEITNPQYEYNCEYANRWHKGANQVNQSDINNCGEPTIQAN